jgi:hypothetical protein
MPYTLKTLHPSVLDYSNALIGLISPMERHSEALSVHCRLMYL